MDIIRRLKDSNLILKVLQLVISISIFVLLESYDLVFGGLEIMESLRRYIFGSMTIFIMVLHDLFTVAKTLLGPGSTSYPRLEVAFTVLLCLMSMVSGCLVIDFCVQWSVGDDKDKFGEYHVALISMGVLLLINCILYCVDAIVAVCYIYKNENAGNEATQMDFPLESLCGNTLQAGATSVTSENDSMAGMEN
ncbi:uncharacterized protein LOC136027854 [Artemia franciscana]|uniref:MARVEL domain-containing protein n=1 Tax=Artemia franciscana TaxID=6661 RepID=A0AA88HGC7_ARTSF|nr:hypothetical protein QYM36_014287 [Artemia franciscana]